MIQSFARLIPQSVMNESGSVFYSGREAFSAPSTIYILGYNPGGSPDLQADETVSWHTRKVIEDMPAQWSAYQDESWQNSQPGTFGLQPRILHMLRELNLSARLVPASNVVFVRSRGEADLKGRFENLATEAWPFHQAVIDNLKIKVLLCLGGSAGEFIRKQTSATRQVDSFTETNRRNWQSLAHVNSSGLVVVTLTHPSRADWTNRDADPSGLVKRMVNSIG